MTAIPVPAEPDDTALVERVRSRDPEAMGLLYWRHAPALLRTAYAITLSPEDAEEVVQDVFVALPSTLAGYEERGRLLSWLKRIVARRALTLLRGRRPTPRVLGADDCEVAPRVTLDGLAVHEALAALSPELRIIVVLRVLEGYSHEEIARIVGIRPGTSEVRLHRALNRLRQTLGET